MATIRTTDTSRNFSAASKYVRDIPNKTVFKGKVVGADRTDRTLLKLYHNAITLVIDLGDYTFWWNIPDAVINEYRDVNECEVIVRV